MCLSCEQAAQTHPCELCRKIKEKDDYSHSMWKHRFDSDQRSLCLQCCRPQCTSPHCKTCRVCRDPACKKRKCNNKIIPLHPKQLPGTLEDVATYLCPPCRDITCKCGVQMTQRMQKRRRANGTLGKEVYVCDKCQNKELQRSDKKFKVGK